MPQFEGSNAWVVSGSRTKSGKPLLAGDPHIRFSAPSVWYEAQLSAPGFELYGHYQALMPFASLGMNRDFGWSITMFQNDDLDLIAEKVNPDNPNQVWYRGKWVDMVTSEQQIAVKGQAPVTLTLRQSPHGPIVNDALGSAAGKTPIAMWWGFLESQNPILEGFYQLNRADTLAKARSCRREGPGTGAEHRLGQCQGRHRLVGGGAIAQASGGRDGRGSSSTAAPPRRTRTVSTRSAPTRRKRTRRAATSSRPTSSPCRRPGWRFPVTTTLPIAVSSSIASSATKTSSGIWRPARSCNWAPPPAYGPRLLAPLLPVLREVVSDPAELKLVEQLATWKGDYPLDSTSATLFNQFLFNLADAAMHDELGNDFLRNAAVDPGDRRRVAAPGGERRLAVVGQPQHARQGNPRRYGQGGVAGEHGAPQDHPGRGFRRNGNGARRTP